MRWAAALTLGLAACSADPGPSRELLFDFETGTPEGWSVVKGRVTAQPTNRQAGVHRHGRWFLSTAETSTALPDKTLRGALVSPSFEIAHAYLVMRVGGGGKDSRCALTLRDAKTDDKLRRTKGEGPARMSTVIWDVSEMKGRLVYLRMHDRGGRRKPCAIYIDYVRAVDG